MKHARSLQGRLLALLMSVVAVVWMITAAYTWFDTRHELDELLDGHLAQVAALLTTLNLDEIAEDEHADAPSLHRYAPKVTFQVYHRGRLISHSANAPSQPLASASSAPVFQTVTLDGDTWRVFTTPGKQADVQLFVGEQLHSRADILWALLRSTLWPMGMALPFLALAVWWAVRQGVEPLHRLGQTLAERPAQSLGAVNLDQAPIEMQPMLTALNGLFGRINELMESERRFTADAAHELRTPIAAIRTQAQVALGETDDALRRHALQATLEGCNRATRLVEQLLTLSRLESGAEPALSPQSLNDLIQSVVSDLAHLGLAKQQDIEVQAPTPCTVLGDATLLTVLLRNVIDNAIRYSPPAARILLRLQGSTDAALLTIEDSGPGMSEADLQRVGERFFRVVGSGQSGSGLGWSIVQRIAQVHHASVHVTRSPTLGGLQVSIRWPTQR